MMLNLLKTSLKWLGATQACTVSATGDMGAAVATGSRCTSSATGVHSIAIAAGPDARASGAIGCAICCVERDPETGRILEVGAAIVDGDALKSGTWYTLVNGEFVEADA